MITAQLQATALAEKTLEVLDYLGMTGRGLGGVTQGVRFSRIVSDGRHVLLEVDKDNLPKGVTLESMKCPRVTKELHAQIERPVRVANTTGITFVFDTLKPSRLPSKIALAAEMIPGGLQYPVPIGTDADGAHWESLLSTYHILVGGMTRYGKSTWLSALLFSLLSTCSPDDLDLMLIDNKIVEFAGFNGIPHLHGRQVATSPDAGLELLHIALAEVAARGEKFVGVGVRSLREYNAQADTKLPLVLIVIDEVVDLMMASASKNEIEAAITRIGQVGAAFGIILCVATQKPRYDVISTLITGNFETRVGFRCATWQASKMIIGVRGLDTLPHGIRGRMMTLSGGMLRTMQGCWIDTLSIHKMCDRLRGGPVPKLTLQTPSALDAIDREIAHYCQDNLDGYFSVRTVYKAFGDSCISYGGVVQLGQQWERRGWLTGQSGTGKRRLTQAIIDELAK